MDIFTYLINTNAYYNNESFKKYILLIKNNLNNKKQKFLTHEHHIIPHFMFRNGLINDITIEESEINKVNLSIADHAKAHFFLYQCSKLSKTKLANLLAVEKIVDNYHTPLSEKWLDDNKDMINNLQQNRSALIAENHADCSGGLNSRAQRVYMFDTDGNIIKEFPYIGAVIKDLQLDVSPSYIGHHLGYNSLIIYKSLILSKNNKFDFEAFNKCLAIGKDLSDNTYMVDLLTPSMQNSCKHRKRKIHTLLKCECCGKEFEKTLYESKLKEYAEGIHHIYCSNCCKIGNRKSGKKLPEKQKEKISNTAKGRFWINNGQIQKQIHEAEKEFYLEQGWSFGQLKRR